MRDDPGFIFRVPKELIAPINEIAARSGIPRPVVAKILLQQGVNEPPKWVRDLMDAKESNGRAKVAV